ncbi:hydrogenase expression/formation protein HypE [Ammoniphilus resinae]|uniref:Hydrogenase expression/formation protein HypE n=1 Tax=Ammoniphilus resinae TaxID=861532 RepID=A0ABS4GLF6_9BACL|nr:hydrogenase expression/formation protein HypE [Ammoniphilus resinae]MBP1931103.1 hydrogenase expression/formation protein HypE [Ammoniphilus resinae]
MKILLSHGDGGSLTNQLVKDVFRTAFQDEFLEEEGDASILPNMSGRVAVSTDTFVIDPLEFPGGDIGKLAIAGTVNDLAVSGAIPQYLTAGFILEEGLSIERLKKIVQSMAHTARDAGVRIVAGDTKVVERGKGDGIYINTTGIGYYPIERRLGFDQIQPGDCILINGGIAEHAVAVLSERAGIGFSEVLQSDCRPLNKMIYALLKRFHSVRFMRDPTRGGIATTLKEIALQTKMDMMIQEEFLPVRPRVRGALELLGMEPYYMANEGKVLIIAASEEADEIVSFLRQFPDQEIAGRIGTVQTGSGNVWLKTPFGGTRNLGMLSGTPLPRIC